MIGFFIYLPLSSTTIALTLGGILIFMTGLVDDIYTLAPQSKFLAQILAATAAVTIGIRFNLTDIAAANIIFTIFWIVAITNALNILDNMDGLAAGIAMVAAFSIMIYAKLNGGNIISTVPAIILAGSCAGFWIYNFNPARIFMGDCGSLFIGFTLACITATSTWAENYTLQDAAFTGFSNLILILLIPLAVLVIPIFDTALVSFTRTQTGIPIYKGGRDHTSHRLVMLGFSERRTVLTLMAVSAVMSGMTIYLSKQSMEGMMVAFSIMATVALFFGAFLTNLNQEIYPQYERNNKQSPVLALIMNKKQILQAAIDILLISAGYIAAYLLKFDGVISSDNQIMIERSLP
jgi:UDP-GlcNAc:undecaprenyl-phosphate GlcNAc-1-phosphate transferase